MSIQAASEKIERLKKLGPTQLSVVETVFSSLGLGILAVDAHGKIIFCNSAAVEMLDIRDETIALEQWTQHYGLYSKDGITVLPPDQSPVTRALAGEEEKNYEVYVPGKTGSSNSRWYAIEFRPLRNLDVITGALLIFQDVTDRKLLADEAARSNAALQQFATVAAHDLQEPLRSISGFADMLTEYQEGKLDEKSTRCMTKMKSGIVRMQTLINDLLLYSRIQTKSQLMKLTDCNELVSSCLKSLDSIITESGGVVEVVSLPTLMADPAQLSQLFQNLIANALKFFPADRAPVVQISAKRISTFWQFSVSDNGIGMEPEFFERVFRIFQRLHTSTTFPGTGIGLAICQTIVERQGGRIWVESAGVDQGSTFHFTLPATGVSV